MSALAVAVAVWLALSFAYGLVLVLMVRKRRERNRILADAYERLRGLQSPHTAAARGCKDADQHPHHLP